MKTIDTVIALPFGRCCARVKTMIARAAGMAAYFALGAMLVPFTGCARHECADAAAPDHQPASLGLRPALEDPGLQAFLSRLEEATNGMLNNDPMLWLELTSHSDETTLFPPFGGVERGRSQVEARYRGAAARRRPGEARVEMEFITSGVSGDLAYVVSFERSHFHVPGLDMVRPGFTRVTHVLRREQGGWRLLHRHMDHLPEKFTPPSDWPAAR